MIKPYSKYEVRHFVSASYWLKLHAIRTWNSAPNAFVRPYKTDMNFAFICGCGHSGTTLTAAKLGRHPNSHLIGRESNAFSPILGKLCSSRILSEWEHTAKSEQKKLVIEKTPKHVHSIKRIQSLAPDAKIIITTRNPLDNIASLYSRLGDLDASICRWLADNKVVTKLTEDSRIKVIRYENLTTNPHASLQELCRFLKIEWNEGILSEGRTNYSVPQGKPNMSTRSKQVEEVIKPNNGNWKLALNTNQAKKVKERTKKIAEKLGYDKYLGKDFEQG